MGDEHPPARYRVFWGMAIGAVAAVLLFAGGLKALQTASIVAALPFSVVALLATYGFYKALSQEPRDAQAVVPAAATTAPGLAAASQAPVIVASGS